MAQILSTMWGKEEEEEKEAEQRETKTWRDTKNSRTGLALTLTFIQQGDNPLLLYLLFTVVTGEACPTFQLLSLTLPVHHVGIWGDLLV